MLAREIIGSLSGEGAESELHNLPRLTVEDILVNVSQLQCLRVIVHSLEYPAVTSW